MVVRSSLHRTKYSRTRPNAAKPKTSSELPMELRGEALVPFDMATHDFRARVTDLLSGAPELGSFRDERRRLEDFAMPDDAWVSKVKQVALTDAVLAHTAFLETYHAYVKTFAIPYMKRRLAAVDDRFLQPTRFWYQFPPTLRLQPGPSERFVACHDDAKYGHQVGELNFWLPLTDYAETQTTLWTESAPGQDDFRPFPVMLGQVGVFHGTLCRHKVPPNPSTQTRVSLDFRIGVEGCFDPTWVLRGTVDDHHRREFVL